MTLAAHHWIPKPSVLWVLVTKPCVEFATGLQKMFLAAEGNPGWYIRLLRCKLLQVKAKPISSFQAVTSSSVEFPGNLVGFVFFLFTPFSSCPWNLVGGLQALFIRIRILPAPAPIMAYEVSSLRLQASLHILTWGRCMYSEHSDAFLKALGTHGFGGPDTI